MALSAYSRTFQDTLKEVDSKISSGEINTQQDITSYVSSKDINPSQYRKALESMSKGIESGMSEDEFRPIDVPLLGNALRTAGRLVGETVGSTVDFVDAFTPEAISESVSGAAQAMGEALPEELVDTFDAIFDPYHGEGGVAAAENIIGTVGSYIIPSMGAIKGVNLALKSAKLARSPAARSHTRKKLLELGNKKRQEKIKNIRRAEYLKTRGAQGVGVATAITAIEDPDENLANFLIESFPESTGFMERLAVDPNDTEAEKYLQALINNVGFGAAISPFYVANAARGKNIKSALAATKPMPEALKLTEGAEGLPPQPSFWSAPIASAKELKRKAVRGWTANRGTDNTTLASAIARENNLQSVMREVEGLNNSLRDAVEEAYPTTFKSGTVDDKINAVLRGEADSSTLHPDVAPLVVKMRKMIDDHSTEFGYGLDNAKNKTKLTAINKQINKAQEKIKKIRPNTKTREAAENRIAKLNKRKESIEADGLKAKVDANIGVYLTRGYNFFDDPEYAKNVVSNYKNFKQTGKDDRGVFVSALDSIKQQTGVDDAQALAYMDKLLLKGDNPAGVFDGLIDLSRQLTTAKGYKKRDPLTAEVRNLLGEIKDPYRNFTNTMSNLGKFTAETRFIDDLQNNLLNKQVLGKGLVSAAGPTARANIKLDSVINERLRNVFGEASPVVTKPFQNAEDVYVSKEYADIIKDGLNVMAPQDKVMRTWMGLKGASQASQTVGSVTTHGRNVMGNTILLAANGMLPVGKSVYSGALDAWKGIANSADEVVGKRLSNYQRLGLLGSNVDLNVMKNNLKSAAGNPDDFFETIGKGPGFINKAKGKIAKGLKGVADLYQLEDDMFKIAHFENTLKTLKESKKRGGMYAKMSEEDIMKEAAQRTRDLMPNYALVNKSIKGLSKYLVGDYMAFPAEMIRVTKNLGMYTLKDLASGDAELMKAGAKRLGGMTAVAAAPAWAADYSKNYYGITDKQAEALNNVDASWNYNKDRIFLSGIDRDKNGHMGVDQMSLGYIDPFSYIKSNVLTTHELLMSGVGDNPEMSEPEFDKAALSLMEGAVSPFLAPSMLTEALMDSVSQAKEGELGEAAGSLLSVFTPGTIKLIQKKAQFDASQKLREGIGGEAMKKGLFTMSEGEVDPLAALGLKRERLDLTAGTKFALRDPLNEIQKAGGDFNKLLQDPTLTTEVGLRDLLSLNTESGTNQINTAYNEAQKKKLYGYQQLQSILEDYEDIFGEGYLGEVERGYSLNYLKKELNDSQFDDIINAAKNQFTPVDYTPSDLVKLGSLAPVSLEDLTYIRNQYLGTTIK